MRILEKVYDTVRNEEDMDNTTQRTSHLFRKNMNNGFGFNSSLTQSRRKDLRLISVRQVGNWEHYFLFLVIICLWSSVLLAPTVNGTIS